MEEHTTALIPQVQEDSTQDQIKRLKADLVITRHVALSAGAGILPIPGLDTAAILGTQVSMLYYLCRLWEEPSFSKEAARAVILSLVGTAVPASASRNLAVTSSVKAVPVVGTVAGMLLTPALAGVTTYAIGKVFVEHLSSGGTLLTFDAQKMKRYFEDSLARAKKLVPGKKVEAAAATA